MSRSYIVNFDLTAWKCQSRSETKATSLVQREFIYGRCKVKSLGRVDTSIERSLGLRSRNNWQRLSLFHWKVKIALAISISPLQETGSAVPDPSVATGSK